MGTKKPKGSVSIENINERIRLRWRYQQKRYTLNLFYFSKANLLQAKKIALQIEQDILDDTIDTSLKRYKPASLQEAVVSVNKTLIEHFEDWVKNYRNLFKALQPRELWAKDIQQAVNTLESFLPMGAKEKDCYRKSIGRGAAKESAQDGESPQKAFHRG